jgi:hypothetical protein
VFGRLQDLWPLLGDPPGDLGLVALDGLAGRTLQAPPHPLEDAPHVPGMVRHPTHPLDDLGDPRQGPQVVVEPGRHRPPVQHPPDLGQLGGAELGGLALAGGAQPRRPAVAPAPIPAAGGLGRYAQLAGDLSAGLALGEQVAGLQAAAFQPLQISRVSEHPALGGDSCSAHAAGS